MPGPPDAGPRDAVQAAPSDRRTFLTRLTVALGGLTAVAVGLPLIGFLVWPVRRQAPEIWRPVGAIGDFEVGATVKVVYADPDALPWAGFTAATAAYLRREADDRFVAFSVYCTHTGCPVHWVPGARLFFCPCHGGAFHADGAVAAGPPPRPLERHDVRVRNGQVEIRTAAMPLAGP